MAVIRDEIESFSAGLAEHLRAISARDIDAFAATLDDNPLLVGGNGSMLQGREEVLAAHRDWFATTDFTFDTEIVRKHEGRDSAWALCRVTYRTESEQSRFLLLLSFVLRGGRWKLNYDQNTPETT